MVGYQEVIPNNSVNFNGIYSGIFFLMTRGTLAHKNSEQTCLILAIYVANFEWHYNDIFPRAIY